MDYYSYILAMISEFMLLFSIGNVKHGRTENVREFLGKDIVLMCHKLHANMAILNISSKTNKFKPKKSLHYMRRH